MRALIAVSVLCGVLAVAGCASSDTRNDYAPETMSVIMGRTGLVGGQQEGILIAADGRVTEWSGRSVGQNPQDRGFISESQGDSIWVWIQELDFWNRATQPRMGAGAGAGAGAGSASRFISVTVADSTRRASWAAPKPDGPELEGAGPELYARISAMLDGMK